MRKRATFKTTKARDEVVDLFRLRNIEFNLHIVGAKKLIGCDVKFDSRRRSFGEINSPEMTGRYRISYGEGLGTSPCIMRLIS